MSSPARHQPTTVSHHSEADALIRSEADFGDLEVIVPDVGSTVRWWTHGYPDPLARWHHHPEIEFHLIRSGSGQMLAGDRTIDFRAGQVSLMGPHVPHNWLSDLAPGEFLPDRDVLCQVLPDRLLDAAAYLPELTAVQVLVDRSRRGIILTGASAEQAAATLVRMGEGSVLGRLITLLELVEIFLAAPDSEWHTVTSEGYVPSLDDETAQRINTVLSYVEDNLAGKISMTRAAALVALSPSAFSRFFHTTAGITFSALVRRRRIARACHLLRTTDLPVARVSALSGYTNLANFNRRFRTETGTTPSAYRRGPG
ncbi:helix-turn-helix domain-containing protein [Actinomyces sp. MRS3W]|uniref:helix-turn-helix domain-containing protein n=1 Tax=Actinomyces sp. MRS3W TaxID=2800796 RepID=UPI0028FD8500|nr:helix-turn-helix domain-containing protein [Actinomyces sp. MRS3W]MDU0347339.1 helix-turn-helix domain-containing protein [Actinomyces sp. MRS3W]